jgi:hypothetical protein
MLLTNSTKIDIIIKITNTIVTIFQYLEITSARDLEMVLSPAKTPLLDNVAITFKASPHTSTPLVE